MALRGESDTAAGIYRETLALPTIGRSSQRDIARRLAIALTTRGEYAETLRVFDSNFGCGIWTAEALALRAITYETLGAWELALENFEAAIRLWI